MADIKAKFQLVQVLGTKVKLKIITKENFQKVDGYYLNNDDSKEGYKPFNATSLEFFIDNLKENTNYRITGYINGNIPIQDITINTGSKEVEPPPKPAKKTTITIYYIDKENNSLLCNYDSLQGFNNDSYSIKIKEFNGYTYQESSSNLNGIFGKEDITISLYYSKKEEPKPEPVPPPEPDPKPLPTGDYLCSVSIKIDDISNINTTDQVKELKGQAFKTTSKIKENSTKIEELKGNIKLAVSSKEVEEVKTELNKKVLDVESSINNKIASIDINTKAIDSKISSVENKSKTLENKILNGESKIHEVEQKLNDNSITSTVLNSYQYQENINSKVSYHDFTQFKQDSKTFQMQVENGFGYNLLKNSGFENELNFWSSNGNPELMVNQKWQIKFGEKSLLICGKGNNSGIFQKFKTEKEKVYNVSFWALSDGDRGVETWIGIEGRHVINIQPYSYWRAYSFTFKATENEHGFIAYTKGIGNFYIDNIQVCEGSIIQPWSPHPSEIYGSTIKIDSEELRADYSDGSYSLMGRRGFEHWHNGMARPYKFINYYVVRPQVRNGAYETIVLPEEFQGKELNRDFTIITQHGDIDSNVGARFQKDAIRNIFIKTISWNSGNRQLVVQPCMQKIGVVTATHWGWDSNTTTPGKVAGEGAIDVIIMAQM